MGLFGLFSICFLAATILPFSSELVFLYFLHENKYTTTEILFAASIGNCLGGLTNYFLGFLGNKLIRIKKNGKAFYFAQKYGFISAFFSWLPFVGDPILVALGFLKSPFLKTMILMCLGKVMRYSFLCFYSI